MGLDDEISQARDDSTRAIQLQMKAKEDLVKATNLLIAASNDRTEKEIALKLLLQRKHGFK